MKLGYYDPSEVLHVDHKPLLGSSGPTGCRCFFMSTLLHPESPSPDLDGLLTVKQTWEVRPSTTASGTNLIF